MHDQLGFLWAATAVVWLITLFYIMYLVRQQGQLQSQIEYLEKTIREVSASSGEGAEQKYS